MLSLSINLIDSSCAGGSNNNGTTGWAVCCCRSGWARDGPVVARVDGLAQTLAHDFLVGTSAVAVVVAAVADLLMLCRLLPLNGSALVHVVEGTVVAN
jgi:hypothetical protein